MKRKSNKWFITISPDPAKLVEPGSLSRLVGLFKPTARYVYVVETGKEGTHPHLHIYYEEDRVRRVDDFKKTFAGWLRKLECIDTILDRDHITHTRPFLDIQPSTSMQANVKYMSKETNPIYVNLAPLEFKESEWTQLTTDLIPITYRSFPKIYDKFIATTNFSSEYSVASVDYVDELTRAMDDYGFDISFIIKNLGFVIKVLHYKSDCFKTVLTKEFEKVSSY